MLALLTKINLACRMKDISRDLPRLRSVNAKIILASERECTRNQRGINIIFLFNRKD